jgi:SEC-C motif-containing protein
MRSRYSAFAVGDAGYLLRTWHPARRPRNLSLDPALRVDPPRRPGNA